MNHDPIKDPSTSSPPKVDYFMSGEGEETTAKPEVGLAVYIGETTDRLIKDFGKPQRKEPSAFGYEWWIYNRANGTYMQAGIEDDQIVTIYALGDQLNVTPYRIGQPIEDIFRTTILETEITLTMTEGTYRFELSEEDLNLRPLVQLGDIYAQLFIDKYTGSLSSIRFYEPKTLITQKPYELFYKGDLLKPHERTEREWRAIETGNEKQIFDITNIIRSRFQIGPLRWNKEVAAVAYEHSKDMAENDYFSHDSPEFGTLTERLDSEGIAYKRAAENIGMEYNDGPAVVEGWLNSDSHRKVLFDENFSVLGVGVYKKYYTQNFILVDQLEPSF